MAQNLVIVESPSKCKKIEEYLGSGYKVLASFGHIRELVPKDGSIDTEKNFEAKYQMIEKSLSNFQKIINEVKSCSNIYIATDPDREGESIGWHILQTLNEKKVALDDKNIKRISFNEITKSAVTQAIKSPRDIDQNLVDAQQSRQFLDYLVGFNLSPILWRKLPGSKSAGRVQSVALRIVVEREFEIKNFKPQDYWTISMFAKNGIKADLIVLDGKKLEKFDIKTKQEAQKIVKNLQQQTYKVFDVEQKVTKRKPYPPFTTSTLQQDASTKLGFGAKKTMIIAQGLYEKGLITYMRTDSVSISKEGIEKIRNSIKSIYGSDYLSSKENVYISKQKNAQEAHEAIRPSDPSRGSEKISEISGDDAKLYDLIWRRALASQASDAEFDSTKIQIKSDLGENIFNASGSVQKFDGFLKIYNFNDLNENLLPLCKKGDTIDIVKIEDQQHTTEPPSRYNEASLVKKLEEMGIGRPSTYASIVSVIQEREYVELKNKRFFATVKGEVVTEFLKAFFPKYVEYTFTAKLEDELDDISAGELEKLKFLKTFWKDFKNNIDEISAKKMNEIVDGIKQSLEFIILDRKTDGAIAKQCPKCGSEINIKIGKFGPFASCSKYPDCKYIIGTGSSDKKSDDDPELNGENNSVFNIDGYGEITLKKGPYGYYYEYENDGKKKRVGLPKGKKPSDMNEQSIKQLLSLPRLVAKHPETKLDIKAAIGMYGPYLSYNSKFYTLPELDLVFNIGVNHAVEIISKKDELDAKKQSEGFVKKSFSKSSGTKSSEIKSSKSKSSGLKLTSKKLTSKTAKKSSTKSNELSE
jgi:DNA topoisomerase-1